MFRMFEESVNEIPKGQILFPVLVASSFGYSDESEKVMRDKIINHCSRLYQTAVEENANAVNNRESATKRLKLEEATQ